MSANIITIEVGGVQYDGWTDITVTKSIEDFCGSFSMTSTQVVKGRPFPIKRDQLCKIYINGIPIINGWVEKIEVVFEATRHIITVSGRDRTNDIVDSTLTDLSLTLPLTLEQIIKEVLETLNLTNIKIINPYKLAPINNLVTVETGMSAYELLHIYAQKRQVMLTTDNDGNIRLVRAGTAKVNTVLSTERGDAKTIIESKVTYDNSKRFRTYKIVDQDNTAGAFALESDPDPVQTSNVPATATDTEIRSSRIYSFTGDDNSTSNEDVQTRVNWEANFRRSQSVVYYATVQGFKPLNDNGIWSLNKLVTIVDPFCDIVADRLITNIEYTQSAAKDSLCKLKLLTRDAFTEEVNKPIKIKQDETEGDDAFALETPEEIKEEQARAGGVSI